MTATIQVKRHTTGSALVIGTAPLTAAATKSGEMIYDAIADILYVGKGDDGSGNSTSIVSVAGGGAFLKASQIGANSGVAGLDSSGKVPTSQLPASVTGAMVYQGTWNASTNSPTLTSGTGTKGYFYKVSTAGTTSIDGNASWNVGDIIAFDGTTWDKIDGPAEAVTTVAGRVGAIVLAVADITGAAPLASPALTGSPTAPTATAGTNTAQIATTAFVTAAVAAGSPSSIDGGVI